MRVSVVHLAPAAVVAFTVAHIAAAPAAWGPQGPPYRPGKPIAIVGGLLVDGTGAPPRHDQTVVVRGERIEQIGPMETVKVPDDAEVIDAAGMTVMPGLINSNQHIQINPLFPSPLGNLPLSLIKARWEKTWAANERRAFVYLMQGITSMRNTSGPAGQLLPVKRRIEAGEIPGPRLFLGGALFQSEASFTGYVTRMNTPADAVDFMRNQFAFHIVGDVDADTRQYESADFSYWKLLMSDAAFDGRNDFTDEQLRAFIAKAHRLGKKVDVHTGGNNAGLRRMLAFDVDTLEHPFYGTEIIADDVIQGYVKKGVIVASLLSVMINQAERSADPHRFDESLYVMSMDPSEYRVLMHYRDKMAANLRQPEKPGVPLYDVRNPPDFPSASAGTTSDPEIGPQGPSYDELQRRLGTSKENMRRFIKAGARLSMGTDTGAFMDFQQEDPNAREMMYMVEMGLTPMQAIEAATRNGAEALGLLKELGTLEAGKLADVIVVAGNPLRDMAAMMRVAHVVKGGVRYK